MTDLARLRQLAAAATPGPWDWEWGVSQRTAWALMQPGSQWEDDRYVLKFEGPQDIATVPNPEADMDYIAAFNPTTAAALLDEIESLRAIRDAAAEVARTDAMSQPKRTAALNRLRAALLEAEPLDPEGAAR